MLSVDNVFQRPIVVFEANAEVWADNSRVLCSFANNTACANTASSNRRFENDTKATSILQGFESVYFTFENVYFDISN